MDDPDVRRRHEDSILMPLLLFMTVVTGSVDAVSILRLDHIFVANMTGNVTFLAFALAGASGFSVSASLVALAAFLGGAAVGSRVLGSTTRRMDMLGKVAVAEAVLCAAAAGVAVAAGGTAARYAITVMLAVGMGAQNATARKLAVADLTTTVLTLTLTGLAADPPRLRGLTSPTGRRLMAVTAMLIGAVVGGLLVLNASVAWALSLATVVLVGVAATALGGIPGVRRTAPRP